MALNWQYIKGVNSSGSTSQPLYTFIEFSAQGNSQDSYNVSYLPKIYHNGDNSTSGWTPLGYIITSGATKQSIDKPFSIKGELTYTEGVKGYKTNNYYKGTCNFYDNDTSKTSLASINYSDSTKITLTNTVPFYINSNLYIQNTNNKSSINFGTSSTNITTVINSEYVQAPYFNAVSDKRAKENITPFKGDALKIINSLQTYTFNYKNNAETSYGIMAQDLVNTKINDFCFIDNVAATGENNDYMKVKESKLVYLLLEGIKAQQKEIESLKIQLEELKYGK